MKTVYLISFMILCSKMIYSQNEFVTWKNQLDNAINNFYRKSNDDLRHLELISYVYKGIIKSEIEKNGIIDVLLSYDSPTILYVSATIERDTIIADNFCIITEKEFPGFEIISIGKMVELAKLADVKDPTIQMRKQLNQLIKIGFEYLNLEWSYKGNKYSSICVVSDKYGGIIYEPIGYNNICIRTKRTSIKINNDSID